MGIKTNTNKQKVQKKKRYVILLLVLSVMVVGIICSLFFHLKTIKITGESFYSEDNIKKRFQKNMMDNNTLLFCIKYKFFKTITIPFVDEYEIECTGRNEILITIYEKSIISCIRYMGEYLYMDKDGTIIEISKERIKEIPLVEGISFKSMRLYDKLSVEDDSVFESILDISLLIQRYKLGINVIYFNYNDEVALYKGNIKILLGKREDYDVQIANLKNLLSAATEKKLKGVFDMRDYSNDQTEIILRKN